MMKHIVRLAKRGQLHKKNTTTAENKVLFKEADEGLNPAVARFFVQVSPDTTEETLINWAKTKRGLTVGQASALCLSACNYAVSLLDDASKDGASKITKTNQHQLPDLVTEALEAYFDDDLSEDDDLTEDDDLSDELDDDDDDDDLMDDFSEAPKTTTTTATVKADHISYAEIKAVLMDKNASEAMVNGAFLAFMDEANLREDGKRNRFYGKSTKGLDMKLAKKPQNFFRRKVANFCGIQLLGISPRRGDDWASDYLLKGGEKTSSPKKSQNRGIRQAIGVVYATIAVKAGVTCFNHDLRRYISEATVKKLRDSWVCEDADFSHPSATTNGWFLPFSEGDDTDASDLIGEAASLLI